MQFQQQEFLTKFATFLPMSNCFITYIIFFSHTRYGIECFISDYIYHEKQVCNGENLSTIGFTALLSAQADCSRNAECGCIYDDACKGDKWMTRKGIGLTPSTAGSCSWTKSKLTFPFHTRKLMYCT